MNTYFLTYERGRDNCYLATIVARDTQDAVDKAEAIVRQEQATRAQLRTSPSGAYADAICIWR